jgi:acyl carrier protein
MDNHQKLQDLMRDIFEDEALVIDAETSPEDVPGWDSFANIQLLAAVSESFSVKFTTEEAIKVRTVGDLLALIARRQA